MSTRFYNNIVRAVRGVGGWFSGGVARVLAVCAIFALTGTAWAYKIKVDGVEYSYGIAYYTAKISAVNVGTEVYISIPGKLDGNTVTEIGDSVFKSKTTIKFVEIPDSVTKIGYEAFKGCSSLEQVNIPSGVDHIASSTFMNTALKFIVIPKSVTVIYNSAFQNCSDLGSVYLAEGLTTISSYAFYGCDSLTELMIPDSVTSIGENAFRKCSALERVILPAKLVDSIPASAFADCPADMEIVPRYAETIGGITWSYCIEDGKAVIYKGDEVPAIPVETTGNVTVPSSLGGYPVVAIGDYAFYGCEDVKNVIIPDGVTSIGEYAFCGCDAMVSVTIPPTVASIGDRAFYDCTSLTDANIPDSVKHLGNGVFEECSGLKHVTIGKGVSEIPEEMFVDCSSLTSIILPEGVKSIGNYAFWGCDKMESVAILKNVTSIGADAFDKTHDLTTVYVAPGKKDKVKALLDGSGRDTSGLTFVEVVTVTFNANGGTCATASVLVPVDTAVGTLPDATRDGYVFDGWFTAAEGGEKVSSGTIVNSDATYYAHWAENTAYTWFTKRSDAIAEALRTGKKIFLICGRDTCYNTMTTKNVSCEDPTVKPKLVEKCVLWYSNCDTQEEENWYYWPMGVGVTLPLVCIIDPNNPGSYIKRVTGGDYGGPLSAADVLALIADIPYPSASGTSGYVFLDAKDITEPYSAGKTLYGAVYNGSAVAGVVELKLGKVNARKGTSRVSGIVTLLDGKRYIIKALQATMGAPAPLSVSLDVNKIGTMAITIGGDRFAGSLGNWHVQVANVGGNWKSPTATVSVDIDNLSAIPGTVQYSLLPAAETGISFGTRWSFSKATSVKWAKPKLGVAPVVQDATSGKGLIVDTTKDKTNLSSMRLTYAAKKGTFKGSFKVYSLEGSGASTKLKKYTMKVGGVVVDGVGYGTATCRRPALNWTVTVR